MSRNFRIIYEVVKLVAIAVLAIAVVNLNSTLTKQDETISTGQTVVNDLHRAIDQNTSNVISSRDEIKKAKELIEDTVKAARDSNDPTLAARINKGLDQINKICIQIKCEGP